MGYHPKGFLSFAFSAAGAYLLVSSLVACQANPGAAPTVESSTSSSSTPTPRPSTKQPITIGVGQFSSNLNPHLAIGQDFTTQLVASLVLPSVFEQPVLGVEHPILNSDLIDSIVLEDLDSNTQTVVSDPAKTSEPGALSVDELTGGIPEGLSGPPVKVTYKIVPGAQWSDGTPITQSDFRYLWQQMTTQVGLSGATAYQSIDTISGRGGSVIVEFSEPNIMWQELFRNLIPSHAYRSSMSGFQKNLEQDIAASGNRYLISSVDARRGQIILKRNERFWGDHPAQSDEVILTSISSENTIAQRLRTDSLQYYAGLPTGLSRTIFSAVPDIALLDQSRPQQLNLVLNTGSELFQDIGARSTLSSFVDRQQSAQIVTSRQTVRLPEYPEVEASSSMDASALIKENNEPLTIGVVEDQDNALLAARNVADQLTKMGVEVQIVSQSAENLYSQRDMDAWILWQDADTSASTIAEHYLCKATPEALDKPESAEPESADYAQTYLAGSNVSGICIPGLDRLLQPASSQGLPAEQQKAALALVSQDIVVLPLVQDVLFTAARRDMQGPAGVKGNDYSLWPATRQSGIFGTVAQWQPDPEADDRLDLDNG